jgi:molecular chaperone DnaJ
MQDYYKVLGVAPDANLMEIKEAYRILAFRYHPDRNQNNIESNEIMREINVANDILSNPKEISRFNMTARCLKFSFALQI